LKKSKFLKTNGLRGNLLKKQKGLCCYCEEPVVACLPEIGKPVNPRMATIEHLKRRVDGGKSEPDNLAIACHSCNHGRGQIDWLSYKSWVLDNKDVAKAA
jgi:5-methylcytosine-specific restriction endonuclease McrA